jgi:isopentenyl phosphate kinase
MSAAYNNLQLLKLGGSLITDKSQPRTARLDVIKRLAGEIGSAREQVDNLKLIIGHGAGSFGHVVAKKYGTREGVSSPKEWLGFADVWREAAALNRIIVDSLAEAGLPVISLPPSAAVIARDGQVKSWDLEPLQLALEAGLLPVVFGDVVFDNARGGTILSTEDLFSYIAVKMKPHRILLAGLEDGVWADYPTCQELVKEVTPDNINSISASLGESSGTDVTGGMIAKVKQSLDLVEKVAGLKVYIFSGEKPGAITRALTGETLGTAVSIR